MLPQTDLIDDFRAARSLPLDWLRLFVNDRQVTIAGTLAGELATSLGSRSRVFLPALSGVGVGRLPYWSGPGGGAEKIDPSSLYETDILIVADLGWSRHLLTDHFATRAAAANVRNSIILPVILNSCSGLTTVSWSGFSETTTQEGRSCRWCVGEGGEAYVVIRRADFAPGFVRFHFTLSTLGGTVVAVRDGAGEIMASSFTTMELHLPIGDTMVTFHAMEPDASSAVQYGRQEARPGPFALCSPWLENHQGKAVLGDHTFFEGSLTNHDRLTDIYCRTRLHSAGFPYVGGVIRSNNGGTARVIPLTRGDIFSPEPLHLGTGQAYSGMPIFPSDVVWYVASMNATLFREFE